MNQSEPNDEEAEPADDDTPDKPTNRKKQTRRKKELHKKVSRIDPKSGWFCKGAHKHVSPAAFRPPATGMASFWVAASIPATK